MACAIAECFRVGVPPKADSNTTAIGMPILRRIGDFPGIHQVERQESPGQQVADQGDEVVQEEDTVPGDVEAVGDVSVEVIAADVGEEVEETAQDPAVELRRCR